MRKAVALAETELGLLGWEQVDFFDLTINEEVRKVQEFENTQASLLNVSAELSSRKQALDAELAQAKEVNDKAQAVLAKEREPVQEQFDKVDAARRQKVEAVERFDRALDEIGKLAKQLEARSLSYMKISNPDIATRTEARQVSDDLGRLPEERKLVSSNKITAAQEAARLEAELERLKKELRRIDLEAAEARETLASATRRLTGDINRMEKERKKSHVQMSQLDREKRKPYQLIGACLADHRIRPLNQPQVLEKALFLRDSVMGLEARIETLKEECVRASMSALVIFYLVFAALIFAVCAGLHHLLR